MSKYDEELQGYDITKFKLPYMQLSYYNSTNKTVKIIEVYDVGLKFLNDDWTQINEYVIVKHLKFFDIAHLNVKEDKTTTKTIQDLVNAHNLDTQSFVAIKTNIKLLNSLRSK